jgi:NAD(P)H-flavin reductase
MQLSLINTIVNMTLAGWAGVSKSMSHGPFILSGTIGACAFTAILFQSPSVIRHAFYETFLHVHQLLALLAVGAVWIHLKSFPKQRQIIAVVIAIWALDRSFRMFRLIYRNVGNNGTKAEVEVLPGDAVRVTMKLARPWRFYPGQHAYIYMPAIGWWTSHPFSVAWSEEQEDVSEEKGIVMNRQDVLDIKKTTISFVIRRRTGFTEKLFKKADNSPTGRFTTFAMAEGPYGHQTLHSYGTVLLFAAGVGITHQVPHVRDLVTGYGNGTVAARKVVLVWTIQSPEHLEWIRPWMTSILGLPKRREVLKILLFVTRPRSTKEIHSPSSSVQMFPGKPNIQALVDQEVEQSIGAIGVTVCGVGAMADDVRRASRMWMGKVNIDFVEESFSW